MNLTAIHETGHMLVAERAGWTVIHVTATAHGGGATTFAPVREPRTDDILDVLAGGAAAELCVFGEIVSTCAELAADILVFSTWKRFAARVRAVAETLDAGAVMALASSL